jgi:hypothetical protein
MDARNGEVDDLGARAREADDLAAVDIDRREAARGELERLARAEMNRLDLQEDARDGASGRAGLAGHGSSPLPWGGP